VADDSARVIPSKRSERSVIPSERSESRDLHSAAAGVAIQVDGVACRARAGDSVAAALLNAGVWGFRRSVGGEPRGPLCGMGTCHECRVTIDGAAHRRACLVLVADGMRIETGADGA